jgi:hypothetical protein
MVTTRAAETIDEARVRLAARARQDGVTLTVEEDGRHYATSTSTPGKRYLVTGYSCDCRGFAVHQRCKHHSALLSAMGWLDDADPEPPRPGPPVSVIHSAGHWITGGWLVCDGCPVWQPSVTEITIGGEDVLRVVGDQFNVTAHWIENGHAGDNMTSATPSGMTHRAAVEYWVRALATSVDVDSLLFDAGLHEDRDAWDDLPVGATDVTDVDELGEVA